jgi:hypothetical protein
VLEGLLAGLTQGERHGIVHRDLNPETSWSLGTGA